MTRHDLLRVVRRVRTEVKALMWRLIGLVRSRITVNTSQGRLSVYTKDSIIGYHIFVSNQYEWDLSVDVTRWLAANSSWKTGTGAILDIGANMGVISIGMVRNRLFQKAIAIEPEPRNFALLQENVARNSLTESILCLPFAVADKPGQIEFELSKDNYGDHRVHPGSGTPAGDGGVHDTSREVITVQADSLDNLLKTRVPQDVVDAIALVWIDVQGFEAHAFRGGRSFLSRGAPVLAEVWPMGMNRVGITDDAFCELARSLWSSYWIFRRGRFVRYPIDALPAFINEIGHGELFENVIFTK